MRTALLCLFAAGLSAAAPVPKALKKKSDAELLQGRWEIVTRDVGQGQEIPRGEAAGYWWAFEGSEFLAGFGAADDGKPGRGYQIDPDVNPRRLDFGYSKDATFHAIYRIEGDTLTACLQNDHLRPYSTDFKGGNGYCCYVFRRKKE
jgi:uncharacterized protein (TIGR03067 family)